MLNSEKAIEIINKQVPISKDIVNRVKNNLVKKGVTLVQSEELGEPPATLKGRGFGNRAEAGSPD